MFYIVKGTIQHKEPCLASPDTPLTSQSEGNILRPLNLRFLIHTESQISYPKGEKNPLNNLQGPIKVEKLCFHNSGIGSLQYHPSMCMNKINSQLCRS